MSCETSMAIAETTLPLWLAWGVDSSFVTKQAVMTREGGGASVACQGIQIFAPEYIDLREVHPLICRVGLRYSLGLLYASVPVWHLKLRTATRMLERTEMDTLEGVPSTRGRGI